MFIEYALILLLAAGISYLLWNYLAPWITNNRIVFRAADQIEKSFSYEWLFLDEILVQQEHHPSIVAYFNLIGAQSLDERRVGLCYLCVAVAAYEGRMQSALLTAEFADAYRVLISRLPEEYRSFYQTTKSLKPLRVYIVKDGEVKEGVASPEVNAFFDTVSDWVDVSLSKYPSEINNQFFFLSQGVERRLAVFRFCKVVKRGGNSRRKKKIIPKPAWNTLPA